MRFRRRYSRTLREIYTDLNALFWGGRLPLPQREPILGGAIEARGILVRRVGCRWDGTTKGLRVRGKAGFCTGLFIPPGKYSPAEIRVLAVGGEQERRTLLHEMAHVALYFGGIKEEGHGPRFVAELEKLAEHGEEWAIEQVEYYRTHPE